jgi:hypothetical protein
MRRSIFIGSIPCLVLMCLLVPAGSAAQVVPLQGTFELVPEESDDVETAIRGVATRINFALRGIARSRLRRTNPLHHTISIAHTTSEVTIIMDDRAPVTSPASGSPITWRREDGEVFDLSTRWDHDRLRQTFVAEDGARENVFWLGPDGTTLYMEVTVRSPRLPEPLSYRLAYRRV